MSTTFPRTQGSQRGYDVDEVEDFLEDARRAYTGEAASSVITAESIRRMAFTMRRKGYSPEHVDAALERLEDAFALREREQVLASQGEDAWYGEVRETAQTILDRLVRPRGQRFRRVGIFTNGYSVREVDALADRIAGYFQNGTPVEIERLRGVAFSAQRGGYHEAQVDILIDSVIHVMLAVR